MWIKSFKEDNRIGKRTRLLLFAYLQPTLASLNSSAELSGFPITDLTAT
jgi:hypothetical protein